MNGSGRHALLDSLIYGLAHAVIVGSDYELSLHDFEDAKLKNLGVHNGKFSRKQLLQLSQMLVVLSPDLLLLPGIAPVKLPAG